MIFEIVDHLQFCVYTTKEISKQIFVFILLFFISHVRNNSKIKIVAREANIDSTTIQMYARLLSWLDIGTSIKCGEVKLT